MTLGVCRNLGAFRAANDEIGSISFCITKLGAEPIFTWPWQVLSIIKKLDEQKGFVVLPMRWIVERTLAWINKNWRLSKDYEFEPKSSEAMIKWAMIAVMIRRFVPA